MPTAEQVIASLTPASLERTIRTMIAQRDPNDPPLVAVEAIAERLLADCPFSSGEARIRAYEQLAPLIKKQVADIEGMRYITND